MFDAVNQYAKAGKLDIGILAVEGMMLSIAAGVIDGINIASTLARRMAPQAAQPSLSAHLLSVRADEQVRTSSGLVLNTSQANLSSINLLLVPGMIFVDGMWPDSLQFKPEIEFLQQAQQAGVRLGASCSGTVLLALSGCLNGRAATTSWWLAEGFKKRFPQIRLNPERLLVEDGQVVTSGGGSAMYSLLLSELARVLGPELAQATARIMLVDIGRQSQAPYVSRALLEVPRHSLSERIDACLQDQGHRDVSVAELAAACKVSERSLLRHFQQQHGMSAQQWLSTRRIERACALLEATLLSLDEIVERCGYQDPASFRKLFKRQTSLTPAAYRARFRLRSH
jgi:transcriptional regulator GlxA family with amidase domain